MLVAHTFIYLPKPALPSSVSTKTILSRDNLRHCERVMVEFDLCVT